MPKTYQEAINGPDSKEWDASTKKEIKNLIDHDVFEVVKRPPDDSIRNVIKPKWVFTIKYNKDGSVDKYKSRIVGKGFTQQHGIDYKDTFSPVAHHATRTLIYSLIATKGLQAVEFDVSGAFLTAGLEKEFVIYMKAPRGMDVPIGSLLRLKKALYGLKQGGRCFNKEFTDHLKSIGLTQSSVDNCLFYKHEGKDIAILSLHVDDGILACSSPALKDKIIADISKKYKLGTVRQLTHFLGEEISLDGNNLKLTMRTKIQDLVEELSDDPKLKRYDSPCSTQKLLPRSDDEEPADSKKYMSLVGSLLYISGHARPDISYAVNQCTRHMQNPGKSHWEAAIRILGYLHNTIDVGMEFRENKQQHPLLEVYTDSDHMGSRDAAGNLRSVGGHLLFHEGNLISWRSHTQKSPTLSTTESEMVEAVEGAQVALFISNVLNELGYMDGKQYTSYCDNHAAVKICNNQTYKGRLKHIDIKYHFLRHQVTAGIADVKLVSTHANPADILTKPLPRETHLKFAGMLLVLA